jgi:hypothetical protein
MTDVHPDFPYALRRRVYSIPFRNIRQVFVFSLPAAGPPSRASALLSVTFASCCLVSMEDTRFTRSARVASLPACLAAAAAAAPAGAWGGEPGGGVQVNTTLFRLCFEMSSGFYQGGQGGWPHGIGGLWWLQVPERLSHALMAALRHAST